MEDLVGVGVADACEQPRIGERALEGVVLEAGARGEVVEVGFHRVEPAAIEGAQRGFA